MSASEAAERLLQLEEEKRKLLKELPVETRISDYKGNPVFVMQRGHFKEFKFGLAKAKMVLEVIGKVQKFVDDHSK